MTDFYNLDGLSFLGNTTWIFKYNSG